MLVFYQGILASVLFHAVLCWGGSITVEDKTRINKLIKKAGSVISMTPDSLEGTLEKRIGAKLQMVMFYEGHPLYGVFNALRS